MKNSVLNYLWSLLGFLIIMAVFAALFFNIFYKDASLPLILVSVSGGCLYFLNFGLSLFFDKTNYLLDLIKDIRSQIKE